MTEGGVSVNCVIEGLLLWSVEVGTAFASRALEWEKPRRGQKGWWDKFTFATLPPQLLVMLWSHNAENSWESSLVRVVVLASYVVILFGHLAKDAESRKGIRSLSQTSRYLRETVPLSSLSFETTVPRILTKTGEMYTHFDPLIGNKVTGLTLESGAEVSELRTEQLRSLTLSGSFIGDGMINPYGGCWTYDQRKTVEDFLERCPELVQLTLRPSVLASRADLAAIIRMTSKTKCRRLSFPLHDADKTRTNITTLSIPAVITDIDFKDGNELCSFVQKIQFSYEELIKYALLPCSMESLEGVENYWGLDPLFFEYPNRAPRGFVELNDSTDTIKQHKKEGKYLMRICEGSMPWGTEGSRKKLIKLDPDMNDEERFRITSELAGLWRYSYSVDAVPREANSILFPI
ncbi:hypothetical protein BCR39DRAFT_503441 [Naematelia encephala]|uniref:Uncharacterized protein n=1 Tax=Naematelia encephala TaxID=71784 RepID=A0A1Y2BJQ9_9TREE|nr:hypothetical protein BCR39DRAFT_503441 [Naematelia encephala]